MPEFVLCNIGIEAAELDSYTKGMSGLNKSVTLILFNLPSHPLNFVLSSSVIEQTTTQIALWMIGTVTIAARRVTASHLPTTPPPSPTLQCTSIPWGTSSIDTPTTTTSMSWTMTTEPWGNKYTTQLLSRRLAQVVVITYPKPNMDKFSFGGTERGKLLRI